MSFRHMKTTIFIIVLFILISCSEQVAPSFYKETSIAAIISPYFLTQEIYVYYTFDEEYNPNLRNRNFVMDADVRVYSTAQNVILSVSYGSNRLLSYRDTSDKLKIVPGQTYFLSVETETGIITGQTTAPDSFKITVPISESTFPNGTNIRLEWEESKNAEVYLINHVLPPDTVIDRQTGQQKIKRLVNTDFTYDTNYFFSEFSFTHKGKHILRVMACDRNFKRHMFDEVHISGIQGGYGYFGSGIVDSVVINIGK